MRELGNIFGAAKCDTSALQLARPLAENLPRTVHKDVRDQRIIEQLLERPEAEQLGAHRVELGVGDRDARRRPYPLAKKRPSPGLGIDGQQAGGIDSRCDLADARNERWIGHASARSSTSTARKVGARAAKASSAR